MAIPLPLMIPRAALRMPDRALERFGDTRFQRGLVVFHDEQAMAIFIANMLTNLPLSEDRDAKR